MIRGVFQILKTIPILQNQIDALLEFQVSAVFTIVRTVSILQN